MHPAATTPSREAGLRRYRLGILGLMVLGGALLLGGAAALALAPRPGSESSAVPVSVNYQAPRLALTDLDDRAVSLEEHRGQVILVNNWATWCPPCREEMPALQAFYERHAADGFTIIAIEAGEPVDEVAAFARQMGLTFIIWPDAGQESLKAFGNLALPNSYVIDRQGIVRLAWNGAITLEMLEKTVAPLIAEETSN